MFFLFEIQIFFFLSVNRQLNGLKKTAVACRNQSDEEAPDGAIKNNPIFDLETERSYGVRRKFYGFSQRKFRLRPQRCISSAISLRLKFPLS